jgi:hypothetical protein
VSRILLITDESALGPRVLQRAKTYEISGNHVIILADRKFGERAFEIVDGIRCEFFLTAPITLPQIMIHRFATAIKHVFSRIINRFGAAANATGFSSSNQVDGHLVWFATSLLSWIRGLSIKEAALVARSLEYRPDYLEITHRRYLRVGQRVQRKLSIPIAYHTADPLSETVLTKITNMTAIENRSWTESDIADSEF